MSVAMFDNIWRLMVRAGTNTIHAMCTKCKNPLGVIYDCKMSIKIKGKFRVLRWMR